MNFKDVEAARDKYKSKLKKSIAISISIIVAFISSFILAPRIMSDEPNVFSYIIGFLMVLLMLGALAAISFPIWYCRKEREVFRSTYKAYFVKQNLAKTFTELKYNHEMGLAEEALLTTQMINTGDVYNSNDLATGKYKDVAFTQADVHIQEEHTDSDGDTHYVTIFKGRFMIFEFPKKFTFRLEVVEKWFGASRVPGKNKDTGRKFEKIQLESSEFNKIFNTYAEDGFEAFYLLDPAFIHNILELDQQYKGKLFLGFIDNKLVVGLNDNKDAFEPPNVFKKLDEAVESEKIAKDIRLITHFIDNLKLDRKLFN